MTSFSPTPPPPTPTASSGTVLVVDDQPANLGLLLDVLAADGLDVLVAEDGVSALHQLQHATPDLVLLDVVMPGLDGFATCARLKADARLASIPVLFMTAQTEVVDRLRGFAVGGADYITKPFFAEEVLARVRTHLRLRALQHTLEERNTALAEEVERRTAAETQLARSLDRAAILIGRDGQVQFATQLARLIVQRWMNPRTGSATVETAAMEALPPALTAWALACWRGEAEVAEEFSIRAHGGGFVARLVADPTGAAETALVLLEEKIDASPLALRALGLTAREAEVLFWLAQGKTYREIGAILACAWRTAQTHAERIFEKLGVENRHTAADLARTHLGSRTT